MSWQSKPARVPSRSIDVSRISPAPRASASTRPFDGVAIGGDLAASREDLEALAVLLGVDGDDDRLAAVALGKRGDERRVGQRGRVDADLVGAGVDCRRGIRLGADAAADGERDEEPRGHFADRRLERAPSFDGGRDVEDHQLVDALGVVALGELRGIAGAAQPFELMPLTTEPSRTSRQAMMRLDSIVQTMRGSRSLLAAAAAVARDQRGEVLENPQAGRPDFSG